MTDFKPLSELELAKRYRVVDLLADGDPTIAADLRRIIEQARRAIALAEAVEAMKANLICDALADGTIVHGWFTVAPCEYGEAVDDALAAYRATEQPKEQPG